MEIYIKPAKQTSTDKSEIFLGDIAEVVSEDAAVGGVKILDIQKTKKHVLLVSALDIIRALKQRYPQATVINLGESDVLIHYAPKKRRNKLLGALRISFVTLVLFAGSSAAIMSFYTDAQMSRVFKNMHYVITGIRTENPKIIEIPYCFGLAAGIIVFFNHAGGKKLDNDPTPMEVEMASYDSDVADTMISALSKEKPRNG